MDMSIPDDNHHEDDQPVQHGLDQYLDNTDDTNEHADPLDDMDNNDNNSNNHNDEYTDEEYNNNHNHSNDNTNQPMDDYPLTKWQHEHELKLQSQLQAEHEQKQIIIKQAQSDIDSYNTDKLNELNKTKKQNRIDEHEYFDENASLMKHGTVWVCV